MSVDVLPNRHHVCPSSFTASMLMTVMDVGQMRVTTPELAVQGECGSPGGSLPS